MAMGLLDIKFHKYQLKRITSALKRRGLAPEIDGDAWGIHGPHDKDMNYQWYEGWAYNEDNPDDFVYVHIYPRVVYAIDPEESYSKQYTQENRIWINQE